MSKAFTRESDDLPEERLAPPRAALPPGVTNYLTQRGAERIRAELARLRQQLIASSENSSLAGQEKLGSIERLIARSERVLESAVEVKPAGDLSRVKFGLSVKVRDETGEVSLYEIVGVDEANFEQGRISWLSPLAKALVNRAVGEKFRFRSPAGEQMLEILEISGPAS